MMTSAGRVSPGGGSTVASPRQVVFQLGGGKGIVEVMTSENTVKRLNTVQLIHA